MARAKIEPTGCCVYKGKIQLRFSFFLEPGDARYEEHHVQVPIMPTQTYPGELLAIGDTASEDAYAAWLDTLPKEWQVNPFHNHFVYVDADTTDGEIERLMAESLEEFFAIWSKGENILEAWRTKPLKSKVLFVAGSLTYRNRINCQNRLEVIRARDEWRS